MKVPLKKGQVTKENTKFGLFENQEDNCFIFLFPWKKIKKKSYRYCRTKAWVFQRINIVRISGIQ